VIPFVAVEALQGKSFANWRRAAHCAPSSPGVAISSRFIAAVGWAEILKNLLSLRLPVLGAANEWRAIRRLAELGVESDARRRLRAARRQSGDTAFLYRDRGTGADDQS
jgi:hypothetical protein